MIDFLKRPIDVGDYLLSPTAGFIGSSKPFTIYKVGKLVEYNDETFYIIEDRDDREKLALIKDGSKYYKISDGDLMLEKLQQG